MAKFTLKEHQKGFTIDVELTVTTHAGIPLIRTVKAIVDTGAEVNCISTTFCLHHGIQVFIADATNILCLGAQINHELWMNHNTDLQLQGNLGHQDHEPVILIGRPMLEGLKLVVDKSIPPATSAFLESPDN